MKIVKEIIQKKGAKKYKKIQKIFFSFVNENKITGNFQKIFFLYVFPPLNPAKY